MALARIITRSQTCSRELALVLLARGYAVEIVSPDKVPDNIADLELRVDAGSANELIANVEAHDGERTTSLDFVHHLKAPLVDFERRPSEPSSAAHILGAPPSIKTGPGIEDFGPSAEAPQPTLRAASQAPETLSHREPDPSKDLRLSRPKALLPLEEFPGDFAIEDAALPKGPLVQREMIRPSMAARTLVPQTKVTRTMVSPAQAAQLRNRSGGWPWRAGLVFGSVVLLAFVLAVGMRPGRKAGAQSSEQSSEQGSDALPVGGIVAPSGVNPSSAPGTEKYLGKDSAQISAVTWGLSAADSSHAPKGAQVAKSATANTSSKSAVSRKRGDDLIARDTTIYFDKRFEPPPKAKRTKPIARRQGDLGEHH